MTACPHCGKPVRVSAKFCPNCGKTIAAVAAAPAPVKAVAPQAPVTQPPQPVVTPPPPPPPPGKPRPVAEKPKGKKRRFLWVIVLGLLAVVCILATVIIGWVGYKEQISALLARLRGGVTPTVEVSVVPSIDPNETPVITETVQPPTGTPTGTPTITATTGVVVTPSLEGSETPLADDFSGVITDKWTLWGPAPARVDATDPNKALILGSTTPNDSGITSIQQIVIQPGVEIEFMAKLDTSNPDNVLHFDWVPGGTPPTAHVDGAIQITLSSTTQGFKIQTDATPSYVNSDPTFSRPDSVNTYKIEIKDDMTVEFYVNGVSKYVSLGTLFIASPGGVGYLTFSGNGLIDDVKVENKSP